MRNKLFKLASLGSLFLFALPAYAKDTLVIPRPNILPEFEIGNVVSAILGILLLVSAILAFLYLIMGGIQWITSGGDKTSMEAARNKITSAIVGLIIVAAAWAVMLLVNQFIGIDFFNVKIPSFKAP